MEEGNLDNIGLGPKAALSQALLVGIIYEIIILCLISPIKLCVQSLHMKFIFNLWFLNQSAKLQLAKLWKLKFTKHPKQKLTNQTKPVHLTVLAAFWPCAAVTTFFFSCFIL